MVMKLEDKLMGHWDWQTLFPRSAFRVIRVDLAASLDKQGIYYMQRQLTKLIYNLGEAAEERTAISRARSEKAAYELFKATALHTQRDTQKKYQELYKAEIEREQPQELTEDEAETVRARYIADPLHVVGEET